MRTTLLKSTTFLITSESIANILIWESAKKKPVVNLGKTELLLVHKSHIIDILLVEVTLLIFRTFPSNK